MYIETSGYENGKLIYSRVAIRGTTKPEKAVDEKIAKKRAAMLATWSYQVGDDLYRVVHPLKQVAKTKADLAQEMQWYRTGIWQRVLQGLVPREDLSQEQRRELKSKIHTLQDEDLLKVGCKIAEDTFMGHKVKRYELQLIGGQAVLWMYGDIPLKEETDYVRGGFTFKRHMVATKVLLNKKLPLEPFTPPKGYQVLDSGGPFSPM
jgi:hypothetical protein